MGLTRPSVSLVVGQVDDNDKREEVNSRIARLRYPDGQGSASIVPPPSSAFVRAYYLTSSEHAKNNIERRRLKVAPFSEVNDTFELLGLNCRTPKVRKLTKCFRDSLNSTTGLLSFSADWTNPLIWSHYANRHRAYAWGLT